MNNDTITEKEKICKEQKYNSSNIEKAFAELLDKPVWVASNIRKGKIPINPKTGVNARSNDPKTWGTFAEVRAFIDKNTDHLPAIALSKEHSISCLDLDNVCEGSKTLSWAQDVVNLMASYTEKSVSENGLHVFIIGKKPGKECKKGQIEIYDDNKFITLTGNILPGHSEIKSAQEFLNTFYAETFKDESASHNPQEKSPPLSDEEILTLCRKEKNSSKFTKLFDQGNLKDHVSDHSAGDLALCSKLAFYTQDIAQIDRLFRQSKLCRDKWEREDYRENTIKKALEGLKETWQPSSQKKSSSTIDTGLCKEQPFPYQVLPKAMQDIVIKISQDSDSDPAIAGTGAQALASIALKKNVKVIEKDSPKIEHFITFFHTVVGGSAQSRKSSNTKPLLRVFDKYHEVQRTAHKKALKEYENAKRAAEKAKKSIFEDNLKTIEEKARETTAIDLELEKLKPEFYRLFSTDTTGPAFIMRLSETNGCYSVFTTDGGDLIDFIIGNSQTGTNDMVFVKLITNDHIHVDRVGPDRKGIEIDVPDPCGSVFIMTQEERWVRFNTHVRLHGSGLLGRNNPCIIAPRKTGYLEETTEKRSLDSSAIKAWEELIDALLKFNGKIELNLSQEAKEARRNFNNALQSTVGIDQENYDVADIVHRCVSEAVKRAALYHICDNYFDLNNISKEIPLDTFQRAVAMQKYYLQQAVNARRGDFSKAEAMEITAFLKKWITKVAEKDKRFMEHMSSRDLSRYFHPPKGKLVNFLQQLEEADVVNILPQEGKRLARYQLNLSRAKQFIGMS